MATVKEKIYDEQIAPLMTQVIDICKKHNISTIADFALGEDETGEQLHCTTVLNGPEFGTPTCHKEARLALLQSNVSAFAITIKEGE